MSAHVKTWVEFRCQHCGKAFFNWACMRRKFCSLACVGASRHLRSPPTATVSILDRFWSKVDKSGECWIWTAAMTAGYGSFAIGSRTDGSKRRVLAHRFSWELEHGPIPEGMDALHRCDNPPCVRPAHLFLGDQIANMADMAAKGRSTFGERSGSAILTDSRVIEIKRRVANGESRASVARSIEISRSLVSMIVSGKRWRHVAT